MLNYRVRKRIVLITMMKYPKLMITLYLSMIYLFTSKDEDDQLFNHGKFANIAV